MLTFKPEDPPDSQKSPVKIDAGDKADLLNPTKSPRIFMGVVQNWPFSGNSWKWVGVGRLAPPVESVTRWVRGARGVRQLLLKRW
jgi:hypothetical protein